MNKTYAIRTFGCQMNVADSERIASFLEERGFVLAPKIELARLAIINTCGVRQMAEDRVFGLVRNLRKKNPEIKIVITGCLANRKDILRRMSGVDLFCEIKDFAKNLELMLSEKSDVQNHTLDAKKNLTKDEIAYLSINPKHTNFFQAYVPIMTGCDNFSSYCVVPYARGREASRPAEEVLKGVEALVRQGYRQITLLGQNVNSYKDPSLGNKFGFASLLKKINSLPGKFWVQFISSHPKDMSDELIEVVTKSKKICECVHLPLQAGSNDVLARMNRKYSQKHYLSLVFKIKKAFEKHKPGVPYALTSDIIVGFPSETKNQFLESAKVMQKVGYDMVYFGQFSPRPGTVAWKMRDNISKQEKERRENYLNKILARTALENNKKYLGRKIEILVEKEKSGFYFGKTRTQKNIRFPAKKKGLVGKFTKVLVTDIGSWNLEG